MAMLEDEDGSRSQYGFHSGRVPRPGYCRERGTPNQACVLHLSRPTTQGLEYITVTTEAQSSVE